LFNDPDSPKLVQLEDILKTYVMYNFDLGMYIAYAYLRAAWPTHVHVGASLSGGYSEFP
jgi:hypothetical protein